MRFIGISACLVIIVWLYRVLSREPSPYACWACGDKMTSDGRCDNFHCREFMPEDLS